MKSLTLSRPKGASGENRVESSVTVTAPSLGAAQSYVVLRWTKRRCDWDHGSRAGA
jgi:hypothetical protein